jgi:uncharacterized protein (DUF736 family)
MKVTGMTITSVAVKEGTKGPDFIVEALTSGNQPYEIGVAWRETAANGKLYLSGKLDSPNLAAPINCALTRQESGYTLIWSRRKRKEAEAAETEQQEF